MSYIFRSSNAAEAGFVEAFFREKGFSAGITANAAIYGQQTYDVIVTEDVSRELETELKAHLQAIEPNSKTEEDETEVPTVDNVTTHTAPHFSLFQIALVMLLATFFFQSLFFTLWAFSRRYFADALNGFGLSTIAYAAMALFIFTYVRRKLGSGTRAFFGLERFSWSSIVIWSLVRVLWGVLAFHLHDWLSIPHQQPSAPYLPVLQLLVIPICYGIFYCGFLAKSLDLAIGRIPAVIVSALSLFVLAALMHLKIGSAFTIVSYLMLASARLQSDSAYPVAAMMAAESFVHFAYVA